MNAEIRSGGVHHRAQRLTGRGKSRSVGRGGAHMFFVQAEDGKRDIGVTGFQTCALPISPATDANRWALRLSRQVTGRPKVLVFSYSYHGAVDESFVVAGPDGGLAARPGLVGPPVDPALTSRVCEFNDPAALEAQLAHGDVAAVLMEPAMTNIGIVLPEP